MIDAPDHAAQERGNRSAGAWLLVALLGIVLSVVVGMMSYGYTTAQAEQRFADVVDYVATQSLSYDAFNSAYTTKNLIRVMEIAGEAARDMERDGSVDNTRLELYADQFNVSALIVTDASGNLVSESSTGDVGYESLATYLKESPVLEVATHPLKSYTARITLADDSVADIGCVTRQDGEGIVIAVRHQSAKAVASNTLKLQSLLDGYETIDSGNIVIESDGKVVATNAVEPTVLGVFDLPATDVFIVDGIKDRCLAGKVRLVNADGEWYLGTFGIAHKFYVYTYASAQRYFEVAAAVAAGVLVLYGGVIAVVVTVRRRADRRGFFPRGRHSSSFRVRAGNRAGAELRKYLRDGLRLCRRQKFRAQHRGARLSEREHRRRNSSEYSPAEKETQHRFCEGKGGFFKRGAVGRGYSHE